jgi:Fis family transcriptional regulator
VLPNLFFRRKEMSYFLNNKQKGRDTMSVNLTSNVTPSNPVPPVALSAINNAENLFVANLSSISLEELVKRRLEVHFQHQAAVDTDAGGLKLYDVVLQQVEKPLLELALRATNGNQVKTAQMLGINRNTLKKKIDSYKIRVKRLS